MKLKVRNNSQHNIFLLFTAEKNLSIHFYSWRGIFFFVGEGGSN